MPAVYQSPGPGLDSSRNNTDFPNSFSCVVPSGVRIPCPMALFRNSTFAGSMKIAVSGNRLLFSKVETPAENTADSDVMAGAIQTQPMIAITAPSRATVKFPISSSKPTGISGSTTASSFFQQPCGQRCDYHGSQQHGNIRSDDNPHCGKGTDNSTFFSIYHFSPGNCD